MSQRRVSRLLVEIGFLAALSTALAFAHLRDYEIGGVMLLGWVLVAVFEWGALRARPHFGSGRPPRWYVPHRALPPPRPLEQIAAGYPAAESPADAPTWIASPSLLADWPVADVDEPLVDEQASVPAEPEPEPEPVPEPAPPPAREPARAPAAATRPVARTARTARHRVDPLAEPAGKSRRFGRRGERPAGDAEVPDGPPPARALPTQAGGEG